MFSLELLLKCEGPLMLGGGLLVTTGLESEGKSQEKSTETSPKLFFPHHEQKFVFAPIATALAKPHTHLL